MESANDYFIRLMTEDISNEEKICNTTNLLKLCRKYHIHIVGIESLNHPALKKLHRNWPFGMECSVFTGKSYVKDHSFLEMPSIWKVHEDFMNLYGEDGGCGNSFQHEFTTKFIIGVYVLHKNKQYFVNR